MHLAFFLCQNAQESPRRSTLRGKTRKQLHALSWFELGRIPIGLQMLSRSCQQQDTPDHRL